MTLGIVNTEATGDPGKKRCREWWEQHFISWSEFERE